MLKQERQRRILELLQRDGRLVAAELPAVLGVSGHTVRRDLDELADARSLQRVHGGALARSPVAATYEDRRVQAVTGKIATARAAARCSSPARSWSSTAAAPRCTSSTPSRPGTPARS